MLATFRRRRFWFWIFWIAGRAHFTGDPRSRMISPRGRCVLGVALPGFACGGGVAPFETDCSERVDFVVARSWSDDACCNRVFQKRTWVAMDAFVENGLRFGVLT